MLKKLEEKFRFYFPKRLKNKNRYIKAIKGLNGIEIGGPSFTFSNKGLLPIYKHINGLDGCNFSDNTIWEGSLNAGKTYIYFDKKQPGTQFISEGNALNDIKDDTYDFVLSCHNLEHFANPLKALYEWKRITKKDGHLILVLPNKEKTFDHNRKVTTLEHVINDFNSKMGEQDNTHFDEVINFHDISMDAGVKSKEELRERVYQNFENRCVHHHVFNDQFVKEILQEAGYEVLSLDLLQIHIFAVARNIK